MFCICYLATVNRFTSHILQLVFTPSKVSDTEKVYIIPFQSFPGIFKLNDMDKDKKLEEVSYLTRYLILCPLKDHFQIFGQFSLTTRYVLFMYLVVTPRIIDIRLSLEECTYCINKDTGHFIRKSALSRFPFFSLLR